MSDPRWLSEDELAAWMPLAAVTLFLPRWLDDALHPMGLSFFEYSTLAALSEAPDRTMPMGSLALLANGSLSRMSHTARRLEERGWLERRPSPDDRRVTLATLTEAGFAKLAEAAPVHVESVRRAVFDALPSGSVAELRELCLGIAEAINPGLPSRPPG